MRLQKSRNLNGKEIQALVNSTGEALSDGESNMCKDPERQKHTWGIQGTQNIAGVERGREGEDIQMRLEVILE